MPQSSNTDGPGDTNKPLKKTLSESIYYLGSAKQAADYETTTDFLINHIKKRFNFGNSIGMCLETLEDYKHGSTSSKNTNKRQCISRDQRNGK
jgi:hypothetical protein